MKVAVSLMPLRCATPSTILARKFRILSTVQNNVQAISDIRTDVQAKISRIDRDRTFSPSLIDSFQRKHDYLRISLSEKCNLRCFYCMPNEGIYLSPSGHILTNDEVVKLATLFVKSGITKIRLTGGEPTVRKGVAEIIARLNELRKDGLRSIAMTTNGLALHRRLPEFIDKGLSHLNLSLDTLDPFKFEIITRRQGHDAVLRSLEVALASPRLESVKLNVVVIRGLNDAEILDFVELTKDKSLSVRFIEFMPFTGNKWDKHKMIPSAELLARISSHYPDLIRAPDELNDTARSWKIPGFRGSFGFISSMSDHFCGTCNRLRITADGQLKVCLFDAKEVSLRDELRRGASDEELLRTVGRAIGEKKEKHAGMERIDVMTNRPMILIGYPLISSAPPAFKPYVRTTPSGSRTYLTAGKCPPHLSHMDNAGRPSMVDVSCKQPTKRSATASGRIYIPASAFELVTSAISQHEMTKAEAKVRSKGDILTVAQLAAIMGCKRTSDLIPLCHPLPLSHVSVALTPEVEYTNRYSIFCRVTVSCEGKTGVEMEALTSVTVGLLTVWDMLKAVAGKEMLIGEIKVEKKAGGKSGDFARV